MALNFEPLSFHNKCMQLIIIKENTMRVYFFFLQVCLTFCYTKWNFLLYHDHNRSGKYAQVSFHSKIYFILLLQECCC